MVISYQFFVNEIVTSLLLEYPSSNPYRLFPAPQILKKKESVCAEYAYLSDQYAVCFHRMAQKYADMLRIDAREYCPKEKSVFPEHNIKMNHEIAAAHTALLEKRLKYEHSCYQKNLCRWKNGTISRKKKCRVEFVLIAACWAVGWDMENGDTTINESCRNSMYAVCQQILTAASVPAEEYGGSSLVEVLWLAGNAAISHGENHR